MTLQQLKYVIAVADSGSITEGARNLFISQPSLSSALKDIENEVGFEIFIRSRLGITLTKEGREFLGYARQVVQQMEILEDKYISNIPRKIRFGVSTQHYTFTENAFVKLVKSVEDDRYEFYFNETGTHQILEDVKNRISDLGILYLSKENKPVLCKLMDEYQLEFTPLFCAKPHVFIQKDHPLAKRDTLKLDDLEDYPRLNFVQGNYESSYFSEELFSSHSSNKVIRINDRGAIVNFMMGLNGYTISSGIFPKYLHGENIIAVPLDEDEVMTIGYVTNENQELCDLGKIYIAELLEYDPNI